MITDINPLQKTHLTRIVATLGPASFNELGIEQLIHAGVDVFRINFSHGDHKQHSETIRRVRAVCRRLNKHISILQDLGGPKLRINELDEDHIHLYPGESICLRDGVEKGDKTCIGFTDEDWFDQVKPGERVVLGDGIIHLQIERKGKSELECKVLSGGVLRARAGLNFPESDLNLGAMRPKDWEDLKFGLENNVDVVALSFVQGPEDLIKVREVMKDYEFDPILIAKIERPEAVERIDDILEHSGGIMVARGDLGISVPLQKVPTIQKFLIKKAREQRKLVITATQMLESMTTSPMPTRAEVTDVANAVFDGTDAVMLSGETAIGVDPPLVVRRMSDILIEAEANAIFPTLPKTDRSMDSAISQVVPMLVKEIESKLVVSPLTSGSTAVRISRQRIGVPILAGVSTERDARRIRIYHAVNPVVVDKEASFMDNLRYIMQLATELKLVHEGDYTVVTGGLPLDRPGVTNFLRVVKVGDEI